MKPIRRNVEPRHEMYVDFLIVFLCKRPDHITLGAIYFWKLITPHQYEHVDIGFNKRICKKDFDFSEHARSFSPCRLGDQRAPHLKLPYRNTLVSACADAPNSNSVGMV